MGLYSGSRRCYNRDCSESGLHEALVRQRVDYSMKEVVQMTRPESGKGCQHPERLKGQPGECSPEQIRECHGDAAGHPCVERK